MEEKIKALYLSGIKIGEIYSDIGSRRTVDKIIKEFPPDIHMKRDNLLSEMRKKYLREKNKEYRKENINVNIGVKRQHDIDVRVLSAEKY